MNYQTPYYSGIANLFANPAMLAALTSPQCREIPLDNLHRIEEDGQSTVMELAQNLSIFAQIIDDWTRCDNSGFISAEKALQTLASHANLTGELIQTALNAAQHAAIAEQLRKEGSHD